MPTAIGDTDVLRVIAAAKLVNDLQPLLVFTPQMREKKRKLDIKGHAIRCLKYYLPFGFFLAAQ
ncbi:hypothetical protein ACR715_14635 [Xenorhabdus bovienii]